MLEHAKGQFTIEGNAEDILGGISGAARIARISQTCIFTGGLEGESIAEYTAVLPRDSDGSFQGFQRISGRLGEREGSFVVSVTGAYHRGQPRGQWSIVPKSGSGDFLHIRGEGDFELSSSKPAAWRLAFDLRKPRAPRAPVEIEQIEELSVGVPVEVAPSPVEIDPPAKPVRRKKAEPVAAAEPPVEQTGQVSKSTRRGKSALPAVAAPVASETPAPAVEPARRRKAPAAEPVVVAVPEPAPLVQGDRKRTRKHPQPAVSATPELEAVASPGPRKRSRHQPAAETVPAPEEAPAPVAKRPGRRKNPAPVVEDAPAEKTPAPARRKPATAAPEPVPLLVVESNPPRQRRSKAA